MTRGCETWSLTGTTETAVNRDETGIHITSYLILNLLSLHNYGDSIKDGTMG
jgi:hypothetical protein